MRNKNKDNSDNIEKKAFKRKRVRSMNEEREIEMLDELAADLILKSPCANKNIFKLGEYNFIDD